MKSYKPGFKIGYLGGGQLARMLAESASNLGLHAYALSEKNDDPVAQVTGFWNKGSLSQEKSLIEFLKKVDVATFESEFLDTKLLERAGKKANTKILPKPQTMGILQDRKSQKKLFDKYKLPTSPWAAVDTNKQIEAFINQHNLPVVFKKRFFGYDGYGTFVVKTKKNLEQFLKTDFKPDLFIVEKFIPFQKECAVIIARSADKSFTHFPFVETYQKDSRCDWIKGPIKAKTHPTMIKKLKNFLEKTQYVGAMGVEFFVIKNQLIINEIAPRVHNTGHYSQDTQGYSQFDIHNLCLMGMKLPKTIDCGKGFAMANLIGNGKNLKFNSVDHLHWYGKSENRKGRKMGHLNVVGQNPQQALKQALKKRQEIQL